MSLMLKWAKVDQRDPRATTRPIAMPMASRKTIRCQFIGFFDSDFDGYWYRIDPLDWS